VNIVLIVVDTQRADHLGCYGYGRPTSANIDAVAADGVVFENAYSSDVPTQPWYTATLTGQFGVTTGVVSHEQPAETVRLPGGAGGGGGTMLLPRTLSQNGMTTGAVSTLVNFRRWFADGFEYYVRPRQDKSVQRVTADDINEHALPLMKHLADRGPFFLFIHYWDPHGWYSEQPKEFENLYFDGDPYDPKDESLKVLDDGMPIHRFTRYMLERMSPEKHITSYDYVVSQYDSETTYCDNRIGRVLETIEDLNIADETLVAITSDHGEELGEHGVYFDHASAYEPTVHVPLVMRFPGVLPAGQRRAQLPYSSVDLSATICEAAGVDVPEEFGGKSLLDVAKTGKGDVHDFLVMTQGLWRSQRALRTKEWKLVRTYDPTFWSSLPVELYNIGEDPTELEDVHEKQPKITDDLELKLFRWIGEMTGRRPDPLLVRNADGVRASAWVPTGKFDKRT